MTCIKIILVLLLLTGLGLTETPVDYNSWKVNDSTFKTNFGRGISNYKKTDGSFATINNTLINDNDTAFYCNISELKTRISKNGRVVIKLEHNGKIYEVWQRPVKLIWLNIQTKAWINIIPSLSWGEPVISSNSCTWNFPGFNYSLYKNNGSVAYEIKFKKAFLDSAVILYNQRADSIYIALGNVTAYSFVNIDDSTLLDVSEVSFKKLKQIGDYVFQFSKQNLHWDGSDTLDVIPVKQRWVKVAGNIYCVEYVMMSDIKNIHQQYPLSDIWHNTQSDFGRGANEASDTYISTFSKTTDHSTTTDVRTRSVGQDIALLRWDVINGTIDGQIIDSAHFTIFTFINANNGDVNIYRMIRDWGDEALWDSAFVDPGGDGWGTSGAANTTTDYDNTFVDAIDINGLGDWTFTELKDMVQGWADNTATNFGFQMRHNSGSAANLDRHRSSEHATVGERPYLQIWHHSAVAGETSPRRRKILLGGYYEKDTYNSTVFADISDWR